MGNAKDDQHWLDNYTVTPQSIVAYASSEREGDLRWTVLTISRDDGPSPLFVAEIVGETRMPGELRRVRRKAFPTLSKALSWSAFEHSSKLYDQLRKGAMETLERMSSVPTGMVGVPHGGTAGEKAPHKGSDAPDLCTLGDGERVAFAIERFATGECFQSPYTVELTDEPGVYRFVPVDTPPWDGKDGFRGALTWLYGTDDLDELCKLYVRDWATGIMHSTDVFNAVLQQEAEGKLERWAATFCMAMRHFRRESFHARQR